MIGVVLGLIITNLTTTGKARLAISENKFREAEIYIDNTSLMLHQLFDNVGEVFDKFYFYVQHEYINTNRPATVFKQVNYMVASGPYNGGSTNNELELRSKPDGTYYAYGNSLVNIPFNQNNLTVYSGISGNFVFENGGSIYKHQETVSNPNAYEFVEVSNFDFYCSGYFMEHMGVNNVRDVQFSLDIYDPNSTNVSSFSWVEEGTNLYSAFGGDFPSEAIAVLEDGSDKHVYLSAYITSNNNNVTYAATYKIINCQTGKEKALSSEQLKILKEKSGNTPKAMAEELIKKAEKSFKNK